MRFGDKAQFVGALPDRRLRFTGWTLAGSLFRRYAPYEGASPYKLARCTQSARYSTATCHPERRAKPVVEVLRVESLLEQAKPKELRSVRLKGSTKDIQ